jgi:hypothetical protein
MADDFSVRYGDLLTGSYDCVDRIVLNAFYPLGYQPGGLRVWWRRWHNDSDEELDNTHLMRLAGRFARRVKAWGAANDVPVIFCKAGERKHRIAEQYLAEHEVGIGVFLVLAAKAPASVWKVKRSAAGRIVNIERRREYVNHYSFHIMDPVWGHVTIKMSGHPPFGAQVMLNGHEYVARQAEAAGIAFSKVGNCFTAVADPVGLARIADALSQDAAVGRLSQVCRRWIHSACLCFALDLDEQQRSGFAYGFAVYQLEYSRNLIFADGHRMQQVFDAVVDRTRSRLDVPKIRTMFGTAQRPRRTRRSSSVIEAAIETPSYDLTVFKLHFGRLTGKAYTKGERVLRFEAIVHNTAELRCGRMRALPRDRVPAGRYRRTVLHRTGLRGHRIHRRRCARRAAHRIHAGRYPDRRCRPEQAADAGRALGRARAGPGATRVHRRRARREGPCDDRTIRGWIHHPPGGLRSAQTPRQTACRQTGSLPPLPRPTRRRAHHRRAAHPP